jgi:hypothetical protein
VLSLFPLSQPCRLLFVLSIRLFGAEEKRGRKSKWIIVEARRELQEWVLCSFRDEGTRQSEVFAAELGSIVLGRHVCVFKEFYRRGVFARDETSRVA